MFTLNIFIFFSLNYFSVHSGHIYSQPSQIIPQNAQIASTFNLFFMLETSLSNQDYLYIRFPFSIGQTASAFLSSNIDTTLNDGLPLTSYLSADNSSSDIQFFQLVFPLSANTWYMLQIHPSDTSFQKYGFQGCLSFETTSDYHPDSMIIYDQNSCFDTISFAPPIDNTNFSVVAHLSKKYASSQNDFGISHEIFFDIIPNKYVTQPTEILLTFEKDFLFSYACFSVPCVISDSTTSNCPIDSNISQFPSFNCEGGGPTLRFSSVIPMSPEKIRISAFIVNPDKISSSRIVATYKTSDANLWFGNVTVRNEIGNEFMVNASYSTNIQILGDSWLFWGLKYTRLKKKTGYIGCPIVLYQTLNNIIFNSFHTSFTISEIIQSWPENLFLRLRWTLINYKYAVDNFLMNSISTNLRFLKDIQSSCNFILINSTLVCDNLGEIPQNKYYISGKFSINPSISFSNLVFVYVGNISFETGDGLNFIAKSKPIPMEIKRNVEYVDSTITSSTSNKYYNQFFSYVYSDSRTYNFSTQSLISTIKNQFIGGGSGSAKSAVYPNPKQNDNSINGLFFLLYVSSIQICQENYDGLIMTSCTNAASSIDSYSVLLKIVFNNNILNIQSQNFANGVQNIGTLFKYIDSSFKLINNGKVSDYNNNQNILSDPLSNSINVYHQNNGGIFWHVSLSCKSEIPNSFPDTSCYHILPFNEQTPSASGIGFVNTKIASYPSFYADFNVFDFILCFKITSYNNYVRGSSPQDETLWHLMENNIAGPGVFNSYVITDSLSTNGISFANIYLDGNSQYSTSDLKSNFASYLRLSFGISNKCTQIGVFLEGDQPTQNLNVYDGLATYADRNGIINVADFNKKATIQGKVIQAYSQKATYPSTYDLWWGHHGIIFPCDSSTQSSVFVFIPLQVTFSQIFSLNVVLFSNSQFTVSSIFRVYGSVFGSNFNQKLVLPKYPIEVFHPSFPLTNTWDFSASGSGCINSQNIKPGLNSDLIILPSQTYSINQNNPLTFSSDVSFTDANGCKILSGNNAQNGWGSVFGIYYRDPMFDTSIGITWSYEDNMCIYHTFTYNLKTIYSILCTTDSVKNNGHFGTNGKLTLSYFKSPFFWGANYPISQKLQYIWSNPSGIAVLIQPELNVNTSNWFFDTCSIESVYGIPMNTKDSRFLLLLTSKVQYQIPPNANLTIQHLITANFTEQSSFCYNKYLKCQISPEGYYVLQNQNGQDFVSNYGDVLSIEIYIDTPNFPVNATHSAIISYNGFIIEKCSKIDQAKFQINYVSPQNNIVLSNLQYLNMRNTKGAFSFTFSTNRLILPDYDLRFNMDIWLSNVSPANNFRCFLMNGAKVSNDWSYLKLINSNTLVLKSRNILRLGAIYDLKCISVIMYDITDNSNYTDHPISSILERNLMNDTIADSNLLNVPQNLLQGTLLQNITLQKDFNFIGFNADYIFYFIPSQNQISLNGRIYIEFSHIISPKLNSEGNIECFLNNTLAICESQEERRLAIYPPYPLKISQIYNVKILGVTQPNIQILSPTNTQQIIYFALDLDDDASNGVSEFAYVQDYFSQSENPNVISTLKLNQRGNLIRNNTNLTYLLSFPGTLEQNSSILWVHFPKIFGNTKIFALSKIQVNFMGLNDNISRIKNWNFADGRKIRIELGNDSSNAQEKIYVLSLINISTPQEIPAIQRLGLKIQITNFNVDVIAASNDFSNINSNTLLSFYSNYKKTELIFKDRFQDSTDFIINIGYFTDIGLFLSKRDFSNFNEDLDLVITNTENSDVVRIMPINPVVNMGSPGVSLQIAGKSNVNQSICILQVFLKNFDLAISLPWFLVVKPIFKTCASILNHNFFNLPYNGITNPIIVDFTSCIPESNTNLLVNLTLNNPEVNVSLNSNSFIVNSSNEVAHFYLNSSNNVLEYQQIFILNVASLSFSLDSIFYQQIQNVFINLVPDNKSEPIPFINDVTNSIVTMGCNQNGKIYFVLGLDLSAKNITLETIIQQTENKFIQLTQPQFNDSNWIVYGYLGDVSANQNISVSLNNRLKQSEKYTLFSYCSNLNKIACKTSVNYTWIQTDNGGKNSIISLVFNDTLTVFQRNNVSCAIARMFSISREKVWTEDGTYCNMTHPPNRSQALRTVVQESTQYNFLIPNNYRYSNDDFYLKVNSQVNSSEFIDQLNNFYEMQNLSTNLLLEYSFAIFQDSSHYLNQNFLNINVVNYLNTSSSINVTLQMNKIGYILAGISNYSNSSLNLTVPTNKELFLGYDGQGMALISQGMSFSAINQNQWFYFGNLEANKNYTLFFAGTNLDTTPDVISTKVGFLVIKTATELQKNFRSKEFYLLIHILIILIIY